jgi:hypothetical protein
MVDLFNMIATLLPTPVIIADAERIGQNRSVIVVVGCFQRSGNAPETTLQP